MSAATRQQIEQLVRVCGVVDNQEPTGGFLQLSPNGRHLAGRIPTLVQSDPEERGERSQLTF
jgi:hypothetical protein